LLQKCGVLIKNDKNDKDKQYYSAFNGQVTWYSPPDALEVYFKYKDE